MWLTLRLSSCFSQFDQVLTLPHATEAGVSVSVAQSKSQSNRRDIDARCVKITGLLLIIIGQNMRHSQSV